MQRHVDWEISIQLAKVHPNQVGPSEEYYQTVHDSYTTKYLEALGVEPNERHRRLVARHAPLDSCEIEATWADSSAVASQLRIVQAPIGGKGAPDRGSPSPPRQGEQPAVGNDDGLLPDVGNVRERYVRVSPPDVPDAATLQKRFAQARDGKATSWSESRDMGAERARGEALVAMQLHHIAASEGANPALVEELERLRRRARGDDTHVEADPMSRQWGEEGMQELASLKRKFILPFAAERPEQSTTSVVVVPWQSPTYRERVNIQVKPEHVAEVREAITVTLEQMMDEAANYAENCLPLELMTCRRDPWFFAAVRERLACPEATRLTGLMAHLLYWTVFGHLHPPEKRLPQQTQQSLVLTVQELWSRLLEPARHRISRRGEPLARDLPSGLPFVLPTYILSMKRGVETVFKIQYVKAFSDEKHGAELEAQLVDQLNVLVMNVFDPDCAYASFGALDSSPDAIRLWRKLAVLQMKLGLTPAMKMLGREFRTTPMMLLLMNGDGGAPENPKTRKLLQKSSSEAVLATVAAVSPEQLAASPTSSGLPPRLDERRRRALYRTTCKRIASAGFVISGGQTCASTVSLPAIGKASPP